MSGVSRREFAGSALTAVLVPLLGGATGPLPAGWWEALPAPALPDATAAGQSLDALAEALAGAVRVQYGTRLSAGDLATVTGQIRSALERAEQLRKVELANGDEPDFVFGAPGAAAA